MDLQLPMKKFKDARTCATARLLLDRLHQRRPHLFTLNFRGIPAATQRLHQVNGSGHLLAKQLCRQAFVIEQRGLRRNDIQVGGNSANIAAVGDVERAA